MTSPSTPPATGAGAPFTVLLRGCLPPSAVVGAVAVAGCVVGRGAASLQSAALGLVVGLGYFSSGLGLLGRLLRDRSPLTFMAVGMAIYLAQVLVLLGFMLAFLDAPWLDGTAFGIVVLAVTLAWQAFLWRTSRRGRFLLYDQPATRQGAR